ncbi:MAG: glucosaminidase domain-containing protein [Ignavibacteria bacterium]|nr:glucosaminidase domain-containing protein [Ignavibacteria bacterium]
MKGKMIIDENDLSIKIVENNYIKLKYLMILLFGLFILNLTILFIIQSKSIIYIESEKQVIVTSRIDFSEEKLIKYINKLKIRFPNIVYAQAILETNGFKSKIFNENHNLFGMKMPISRPTLVVGTANGHNVYNNWRESVIDYALFQTTYAKNIQTEEEYLQFLEAYAENTLYVTKVSKILKDIKQ